MHGRTCRVGVYMCDAVMVCCMMGDCAQHFPFDIEIIKVEIFDSDSNECVKWSEVEWSKEYVLRANGAKREKKEIRAQSAKRREYKCNGIVYQ